MNTHNSILALVAAATLASVAHAHPAKVPASCPDAQVVVGFDKDGGLVCKSLDDLRPPLELAPAEQAGAERDAEGRIIIQPEQWAVITGNPDELARSARLVPFLQAGQFQGFKVFGIRPDSIAAALELANGDVLYTVAGVRLSNAQAAMEAYNAVKKLKSGDPLTLEVLRRGLKETLQYVVK